MNRHPNLRHKIDFHSNLRFRFVLLSVLLGLALLLTGSQRVSALDTFTISGRVTDPENSQPVAGITVHATSSIDESATGKTTPEMPIPDNDPIGITSEIPIALEGKVHHVTGTVNIYHTARFDLKVVLISPDGISSVLYNQEGNDEDNLTLNFFASMSGSQATGTWKLQVSDLESQDSGRLRNWSLTVFTSEPVKLQANTDGNGNYVIADVPLGTYSVFGSQTGVSILPVTQKVEVVDQDVSGVDFHSGPLFTISGRVISQIPFLDLTAVSISAIETRTGAFTPTFPDSTGEYSLTDLPAGDYSVQALPPSGTAKPSDYQFELKQDVTDIDFIIEDGDVGQPPPKPRIISVKAVSGHQINIEWEVDAEDLDLVDLFSVQRRRDKKAYKEVHTSGSTVTSFEDTDVVPNAKYIYRVLASNLLFGDGPLSEAKTVYTLESPTNLDARPASSSEIDLTWKDNSTREEGFVVDQVFAPDFYQKVGEAGPNTRTLRVSNLNPETPCTFVVRAYAEDSVSDDSEAVSATTLPESDLPNPPTILTAIVISQTVVDLKWTDNASNEIGFKVERKTGEGTYAQIATPEADSTTYHDSTLAANTTYTYRVRAYNDSGDSPYSNEATVLTPPYRPTAPSDLTATAISSTIIDLKWQDNAINEAGFKLERKIGDGDYRQFAAAAANVQSYQSAGLIANTTYTYRIQAYNAGGDSLYSNEATDTTLPNPPNRPLRLTANAISSTIIDLKWEDAATDEIGFKVERKIGNGAYAQIATPKANEVTYRNSGLTPNTTYTYRVRAYNSGGDSPYSNAATATTPNPPAAPSLLTATPVSETIIDLKWQDNATNETGFKVERKVGTGTYAQIAILKANEITYRNSGLTPNTTYTYRVRAYNASGDSPYSNEATNTPPRLPAAPSHLTATAISQTAIDLKWQDHATNETGFKVERKTGSAAYVQIATPAVNATAYRSSGLTANTAYTYRVRAYNLGGDSPYSNLASAITFVDPSLAPSLLVATVVSQTAIDLKWQDNATNELGFKVERKIGNGAYAQIATPKANEVTYRNSGLTPNTTYTYRVRAYNSGGDSPYSNPATATTPPNPPSPPPSGLTATLADDTVVALRWQDNSSDETGFRVERKVAPAPYVPIADLKAGSTSYRDEGLTPNTAYTYRVLAYNRGGDSAPSNEVTILIPRALGGKLQVTPSSVNFGKVKVKKTKLATVTLRNASTTERLRVTVTSPAAPFGLQPPPGNVELAPGASATVRVSFRPTKKKKYSGRLSLSSTSSVSTAVVALKGTGK